MTRRRLLLASVVVVTMVVPTATMIGTGWAAASRSIGTGQSPATQTPGVPAGNSSTAGSGETVVVDLAGVDFVDVGGTLLLLGATRRAAERGSTLHLAGCNALLIRVLQLTGNLDAVNVVAARQASPDGPDGPDGTGGGTAHPDTASSNGAPAHRVDPATAAGSPRSRGAPRSIRQSHGGHR